MNNMNTLNQSNFNQNNRNSNLNNLNNNLTTMNILGPQMSIAEGISRRKTIEVKDIVESLEYLKIFLVYYSQMLLNWDETIARAQLHLILAAQGLDSKRRFEVRT